MNYAYCLYTWGGFYNDEYRKEHMQISGHHYFNTKEERESYKQTLKRLENELNARYLMISEWEGTDCRIPITLHRTMIINGFEITTHYDMTQVRTLDGAIYHLENKWYPGFNDEPLGDDFDYSNVQIVREWITGPFETHDIDV